MNPLVGILAFIFFLFTACQSSSEGGALIGEEDPKQTQLPKINLNLPPPPSFQKDHPPETYPDSSHSIYGLRKNISKMLNKQVRVKGFLIDVYVCPECPKGAKCKECIKPHFFLADRANGSKDKGLLVTGYPKKDPKTRKKITFDVGSQYYLSGVFSRTSGTGFSNSDGLLIYSEHQLVAPEE